MLVRNFWQSPLQVLHVGDKLLPLSAGYSFELESQDGLIQRSNPLRGQIYVLTRQLRIQPGLASRVVGSRVWWKSTGMQPFRIELLRPLLPWEFLINGRMRKATAQARKLEASALMLLQRLLSNSPRRRQSLQDNQASLSDGYLW